MNEGYEYWINSLNWARYIQCSWQITQYIQEVQYVDFESTCVQLYD